jgi:uncharacterized membrane protein YgcG
MVQFEFVIPDQQEAEAKQAAVQQEHEGVETELRKDPGLFPLAVLLVIAIPPGIALLAKVVDKIIHGWTDHGILIDARGDGAPRTQKDKSLPFGTVVILTRDGDEAKRTDLPDDKEVSNYVGAALSALAGGASATDAASQASGATASSGAAGGSTGGFGSSGGGSTGGNSGSTQAGTTPAGA